MLHLYLADSIAVRKGSSISHLLKSLSPSMHPRALRYKREADAYDFILGRLLLQEGLKELQVSETIEDLRFEESGKPYLESVHFNISHTSGKVICAISEKGRIGIDIEKEKAVELESFESWFTPSEWKDIYTAPIPLQRFYQYWTRKESIIKALGLTLSHLNQIALDVRQDMFEAEGKRWHLHEMELGNGYAGAICSEVAIALPLQMKYVDF